jgi:hypothetical protein
MGHSDRKHGHAGTDLANRWADGGIRKNSSAWNRQILLPAIFAGIRGSSFASAVGDEFLPLVTAESPLFRVVHGGVASLPRGRPSGATSCYTRSAPSDPAFSGTGICVSHGNGRHIVSTDGESNRSAGMANFTYGWHALFLVSLCLRICVSGLPELDLFCLGAIGVSRDGDSPLAETKGNHPAHSLAAGSGQFLPKLRLGLCVGG